MSLPEDTFTNTEADAAAYERLRGLDEDISEPYGCVVIGTPYCSLCQSGTKGYICGPCERVIGREQLERERGEEWFS